MNMPLTMAAGWAGEQARWRGYHLQRIAARLAWAEEAIGRGLGDPANLADHCASLLTLLDQARAVPHLRLRVRNLILALDPWPLRRGYGPAWPALLRSAVAANAPQAHNDQRAHAMLLCALANGYLNTGQLDPGLAAAHSAIETALNAGLADTLMRALDLAVFAHLRQGETAAAQTLLAHVAGQVDAAAWSQTPDMARLCFSYARTLRRMGRLDEALGWADRAVHLVSDAACAPLTERDASLLADAYNVRGVMHWAAVNYSAAAHDLEQALAQYSDVGDRSAETRVRGTLGLVYWSLGELARAEAVFGEATRQAEEQADRWQVAINVGNLGLVALCRGQFRPALAHFERQLSLAEQSGDLHEAMRALGNRGIVRLHRGDFTAALDDLKIEQDFAEKSGLPEGLICNYASQVRCLAGLHRPADARSLAERTLTMARQTGSPALIVIALRGLAEQLAGAAQSALLSEALRLAQSTGRRLDEAACLIALSSREEGAEQTVLWQTGARLLRKIGAAAWLKGRSPHNPPQIVLIV